MKLWKKIEQFLFEPIRTESIGLFRIVFSLLVLQQLVFGISPDLLLWFGKHSIVPFDLVQVYSWQGEARFDLLPLFQSDMLLCLYFGTVVIATILLALGFLTRFTSAYVAMALISLHHHNPYLFNAGDNMMRIMAIFLALSPCGNSYSLDNVIRRHQGRCIIQTAFPWPQRMIQIQLAIAYCGAFWIKAIGPQWYDGSAVYYATRLADFKHNPFILLDNVWFCRIACWSTLFLELAAWTLIWIPRCRPWVLAALFCFHLSIDYLFNLPVFQFVFIAGLITFLSPNTVRKIITRLRQSDNQPALSKAKASQEHALSLKS